MSVDAVHDRLICDEETAVAERLVGVEGAVVSPVAVTVMVTLLLVVPPVPVQERMYVPVVVRLVNVCEPDVALVPVQLPDAVQEVTLVELHVRVEELPLVTDVWLAERVRVGAGVGGGVVD